MSQMVTCKWKLIRHKFYPYNSLHMGHFTSRYSLCFSSSICNITSWWTILVFRFFNSCLCYGYWKKTELLVLNLNLKKANKWHTTWTIWFGNISFSFWQSSKNSIIITLLVLSPGINFCVLSENQKFDQWSQSGNFFFEISGWKLMKKIVFQRKNETNFQIHVDSIE